MGRPYAFRNEIVKIWILQGRRASKGPSPLRLTLHFTYTSRVLALASQHTSHFTRLAQASRLTSKGKRVSQRTFFRRCAACTTYFISRSGSSVAAHFKKKAGAKGPFSAVASLQTPKQAGAKRAFSAARRTFKKMIA